MDHEATREQIELAAAEPGGLDRLMAGDTAPAQAVAAHLAGCPSCSDELTRLERASSLIRAVVREQAAADLRERTLAAVRTAGVQRGPAVVAGPSPAMVPGASAEASRLGRPAFGRGRSALGWVAAIAAAVVLSVIATTVIVGGRLDERLASETSTIEALQEVAIATLQVTAEPDARRVSLASTGGDRSGDLIFSPSTSELVVIATGLTPPPAGREYRCWVELAGDRQRVGKMFFSDDLAYWIGPAPVVEGLVAGATFGVSLVDIEGTTPAVEDVLGGQL